jgi:hypothetical protein
MTRLTKAPNIGGNRRHSLTNLVNEGLNRIRYILDHMAQVLRGFRRLFVGFFRVIFKRFHHLVQVHLVNVRLVQELHV